MTTTTTTTKVTRSLFLSLSLFTHLDAAREWSIITASLHARARVIRRARLLLTSTRLREPETARNPETRATGKIMAIGSVTEEARVFHGRSSSFI